MLLVLSSVCSVKMLAARWWLEREARLKKIKHLLVSLLSTNVNYWKIYYEARRYPRVHFRTCLRSDNLGAFSLVCRQSTVNSIATTRGTTGPDRTMAGTRAEAGAEATTATLSRGTAAPARDADV